SRRRGEQRAAGGLRRSRAQRLIDGLLPGEGAARLPHGREAGLAQGLLNGGELALVLRGIRGGSGGADRLSQRLRPRQQPCRLGRSSRRREQREPLQGLGNALLMADFAAESQAFSVQLPCLRIVSPTALYESQVVERERDGLSVPELAGDGEALDIEEARSGSIALAQCAVAEAVERIAQALPV